MPLGQWVVEIHLVCKMPHPLNRLVSASVRQMYLGVAVISADLDFGDSLCPLKESVKRVAVTHLAQWIIQKGVTSILASVPVNHPLRENTVTNAKLDTTPFQRPKMAPVANVHVT